MWSCIATQNGVSHIRDACDDFQLNEYFKTILSYAADAADLISVPERKSRKLLFAAINIGENGDVHANS
jgi:hypothetical protein